VRREGEIGDGRGDDEEEDGPRPAGDAQAAPEIRRHNFDEVALGYSPQTAIEEAKRCIQCKKPGCVGNCPVEINIPGFLAEVAKGDFAAGIRVLKDKNCLPPSAAASAPRKSSARRPACWSRRRARSPSVGSSASWRTGRRGRGAGAAQIAPASGRKVAIIGGGPAGLTAAGDLAKAGHDVTIFEALHRMGGVLIYGIPEFRLPKAIVRREVEYLGKLGVKLVTDFVVGKTRTLDSILSEFDAAFVGSGAGLPWFMKLPGENLTASTPPTSTSPAQPDEGLPVPEYHTPVKRHRRVAVIGGGNVAMDCARSALRLAPNRASSTAAPAPSSPPGWRRSRTPRRKA